MNKPVNKLHQAIALKDLTKLKARLSQSRKAKLEMLERDYLDQTPLCAALKSGSYDIVREMLAFYQSNKMDVNEQDKNGYTPLHVAASNCDDQIMILMLNHDGIKVNLTNDDKNLPLHYFCQNFKSPNCREPFKLFLEKGVNVNLQNKNGESPLHKSIFNNNIRLLMVNLLLEAGAEVNVLNSRGESPLHFAVRLGREDLVSVLVKAGADLSIKGNVEKKTVFDLATQSGNVKVINFLKNVQDIHSWLKTIYLEQYWPNFVREEIFMDLLPEVDEKTLDSLKITFSGHRLKIIKYCRILKEQLANGNTNISSMISNLNVSGLIEKPHQQQQQQQQQQSQQYLQPTQSTSTINSPITTSSTLAVKKPNLSMESNKSSSTPNSAACSLESSGSISSDELKESLVTLEGMKSNTTYVIDHADLEYTLKLGSGSSGKVYKGIYKNKEVAVKVLKKITTQTQLEEYKKEIQIMASIRSPYVVNFYGTCFEPKFCMVMEYCSRDSLYHVMNTKKYDIGWDRFFQFTTQMTLGIQTLHNWSPQVLHRDFKSLNLLVNEDWECKVCDFGLSRFNTADNLETLTKIRGTFAYCSPEVANGSGALYTTKSDVFSIGIVFWELLMRVINREYSRPYTEYPNIKMDFQIMISSKEGLRPTPPANCPPGLVKLYRQCVHQDPQQRPSCEEIIKVLNQLRKEYNESKSEWDDLIIKKPLIASNNTSTASLLKGD